MNLRIYKKQASHQDFVGAFFFKLKHYFCNMKYINTTKFKNFETLEYKRVSVSIMQMIYGQ